MCEKCDPYDTWTTNQDHSVSWWDNNDEPNMTLFLPRGFVLTKEVKLLLQAAYNIGRENGAQWGRSEKQQEICKALGL